MARKSKTQRAKASAARQARKAQAAELEAKAASAEGEQNSGSATKKAEIKKAEAAKQPAKKADAKKAAPKKQRFKFLKEVRSELKRVTWPTRQEVIRWSGVVVAALLFFGVFVAVLDNLIVTPIVVGISSLGASI